MDFRSDKDILNCPVLFFQSDIKPGSLCLQHTPAIVKDLADVEWYLFKEESVCFHPLHIQDIVDKSF